MDIKQIKELMAAMEKGGLRRLRIKQETGFEIELEKEPPASTAALFLPAPRPEFPHHVQTIQQQSREEPKKKEASGMAIKAPLVGTFYNSPSPADPLFVKVGDRVEEETVVCIIEAMKVMNEIKAGVKGEIAAILVDNAHPVEFGTPLFRVT